MWHFVTTVEFKELLMQLQLLAHCHRIRNYILDYRVIITNTRWNTGGQARLDEIPYGNTFEHAHYAMKWCTTLSMRMNAHFHEIFLQLVDKKISWKTKLWQFQSLKMYLDRVVCRFVLNTHMGMSGPPLLIESTDYDQLHTSVYN